MKRILRIACVALAAFVVVCLVGGLALYIHSQRERQEQRLQALSLLHHAQIYLQLQVQARASVAEMLAAYIQAHDAIDDITLRQHVEPLIAGQDIDGAYLLRNGRVLHSFSPHDEPGDPGKQVLPEAVLQALPSEGEPSRRVIGPFRGILGGRWLAVATAVQRAGRPWGHAVVVFPAARLFRDAFSDVEEEGRPVMTVGVRSVDDDEAATLIFGTADAFRNKPERLLVRLDRPVWEIAARPAAGWGLPQPRLPWALVIFSASIVAALAAYVADAPYARRLAVTAATTKLTEHSEELEAEVRRRTAEVLERNEKLRQEIEERQRAEYRYETIFQNSSAATAIIDADGVIELANNQFAHLMGCSPFQLQGTNLHDFLAPADRQELRGQQRLEPSQRTVPNFSLQLSIRDGVVRDTMASIEAIPEAEQWVISLIDVTRRNRIEAELEQARKQEAAALLGGGLAHDFNNLLSIIVGNVEIARMKLDDADQAMSERLERILLATRDAQELTGKFLTVAGADVAERRPVQPAGLIRKAIAKVFAETHVEVLDEIVSPLPPVVADNKLLERAFTEVFRNAADAMQNRGSVSIRSSRAETILLPDRAVLPRAPDGFLQIIIEDTGKGIPPKYLDKVFDPYFSTKSRGAQKGMGLGLTLAYAIVRGHNGHLQIFSEEGAGATVQIYLPIAGDEADA